MRQAAFLFAVLLCPAAPAFAQVTIDLHALDALPGARPPATQHAPLHHAPARSSARKQATAAKRSTAAKQSTAALPATTTPAGTAQPAPATPQQQTTATAEPPRSAAAVPAATVAPPSATAPPPPATLPTAAPPAVALAPVAPPAPQQTAAAATLPPPPISDTATSTATAISDGLRVTFGADQADLSPASAAAIQELIREAQTSDNATFNVVAYAAGTPEDPSTARRLSLSRALAVRSALIASGVGSARIYVRALGSAAADGPADRVDLTVMGANLPLSTPASAPATPQPQKTQQP
jgi:outer membrane protein OmpA-like peptidoglycan-associated protein